MNKTLLLSASTDAAVPLWRRLSLQALLILGLSLMVTLAAWRWTAQQGDTLESIRFHLVAEGVAGDFRSRMERYGQLLRGGRALLRASEHVDRTSWSRFVAELQLHRQFPGTQGVGFAVRVTADQWAAHERMVRAEGFPSYAVLPPGPRPIAFPILFLEPFGGRNLRAFGFDMFVEPIRREAMARARDTGQPALTGKVTLVQETDRDVQAGVLLYLPFYGAANPVTEEQRRRAIRGFVYTPLRMGDLTRALLGDREQRVCISLYDQATEQSNLLYATPNCRTGEHFTDVSVEQFGRAWVLRVRSTPQLDDEIASRRSKLILGAGSIISLLLMWAVMAMLAERRRRVALDRALEQLESARAEAAGSSAAKGRFLAAASHDLRQPLQSLGLYLHLLLQQKGAPGPVEKAAEQAYQATTRLVEGMFDLAAVESGRATPSPTRFDVAELVEHIASEVSAEAELRGLTIRTRLCHAVVETDRLMLERIIRNLINNGLKYTVSGGLLLACRSTATAVRIKVADSGPGIPEDKRELIFEDLYQIDNPNRDPKKGLGLGLATVARLARLLGYRVEVKSRMGLGSTFIVEIPRRSG